MWYYYCCRQFGVLIVRRYPLGFWLFEIKHGDECVLWYYLAVTLRAPRRWSSLVYCVKRRGGLFLICKSEGNPSELVAIYYPGNKLFWRPLEAPNQLFWWLLFVNWCGMPCLRSAKLCHSFSFFSSPWFFFLNLVAAIDRLKKNLPYSCALGHVHFYRFCKESSDEVRSMLKSWGST